MADDITQTGPLTAEELQALNGTPFLTKKDRKKWFKGYNERDIYHGTINDNDEFTHPQLEREFRNNKFKEKFGQLNGYRDWALSLSPEERDAIYIKYATAADLIRAITPKQEPRGIPFVDADNSRNDSSSFWEQQFYDKDRDLREAYTNKVAGEKVDTMDIDDVVPLENDREVKAYTEKVIKEAKELYPEYQLKKQRESMLYSDKWYERALGGLWSGTNPIGQTDFEQQDEERMAKKRTQYIVEHLKIPTKDNAFYDISEEDFAKYLHLISPIYNEWKNTKYIPKDEENIHQLYLENKKYLDAGMLYKARANIDHYYNGVAGKYQPKGFKSDEGMRGKADVFVSSLAGALVENTANAAATIAGAFVGLGYAVTGNNFWEGQALLPNLTHDLGQAIMGDDAVVYGNTWGDAMANSGVTVGAMISEVALAAATRGIGKVLKGTNTFSKAIKQYGDTANAIMAGVREGTMDAVEVRNSLIKEAQDIAATLPSEQRAEFMERAMHDANTAYGRTLVQEAAIVDAGTIMGLGFLGAINAPRAGSRLAMKWQKELVPQNKWAEWGLGALHFGEKTVKRSLGELLEEYGQGISSEVNKLKAMDNINMYANALRYGLGADYMNDAHIGAIQGLLGYLPEAWANMDPENLTKQVLSSTLLFSGVHIPGTGKSRARIQAENNTKLGKILDYIHKYSLIHTGIGDMAQEVREQYYGHQNALAAGWDALLHDPHNIEVMQTQAALANIGIQMARAINGQDITDFQQTSAAYYAAQAVMLANAVNNKAKFGQNYIDILTARAGIGKLSPEEQMEMLAAIEKNEAPMWLKDLQTPEEKIKAISEVAQQSLDLVERAQQIYAKYTEQGLDSRTDIRPLVFGELLNELAPKTVQENWDAITPVLQERLKDTNFLSTLQYNGNALTEEQKHAAQAIIDNYFNSNNPLDRAVFISQSLNGKVEGINSQDATVAFDALTNNLAKDLSNIDDIIKSDMYLTKWQQEVSSKFEEMFARVRKGEGTLSKKDLAKIDAIDKIYNTIGLVQRDRRYAVRLHLANSVRGKVGIMQEMLNSGEFDYDKLKAFVNTIDKEGQAEVLRNALKIIEVNDMLNKVIADLAKNIGMQAVEIGNLIDAVNTRAGMIESVDELLELETYSNLTTDATIMGIISDAINTVKTTSSVDMPNTEGVEHTSEELERSVTNEGDATDEDPTPTEAAVPEGDPEESKGTNDTEDEDNRPPQTKDEAAAFAEFQENSNRRREELNNTISQLLSGSITVDQALNSIDIIKERHRKDISKNRPYFENENWNSFNMSFWDYLTPIQDLVKVFKDNPESLKTNEVVVPYRVREAWFSMKCTQQESGETMFEVFEHKPDGTVKLSTFLLGVQNKSISINDWLNFESTEKVNESTKEVNDGYAIPYTTKTKKHTFTYSIQKETKKDGIIVYKVRWQDEAGRSNISITGSPIQDKTFTYEEFLSNSYNADIFTEDEYIAPVEDWRITEIRELNGEFIVDAYFTDKEGNKRTFTFKSNRNLFKVTDSNNSQESQNNSSISNKHLVENHSFPENIEWKDIHIGNQIIKISDGLYKCDVTYIDSEGKAKVAFAYFPYNPLIPAGMSEPKPEPKEEERNEANQAKSTIKKVQEEIASNIEHKEIKLSSKKGKELVESIFTATKNSDGSVKIEHKSGPFTLTLKSFRKLTPYDIAGKAEDYKDEKEYQEALDNVGNGLHIVSITIHPDGTYNVITNEQIHITQEAAKAIVNNYFKPYLELYGFIESKPLDSTNEAPKKREVHRKRIIENENYDAIKKFKKDVLKFFVDAEKRRTKNKAAKQTSLFEEKDLIERFVEKFWNPEYGGFEAIKEAFMDELTPEEREQDYAENIAKALFMDYFTMGHMPEIDRRGFMVIDRHRLIAQMLGLEKRDYYPIMSKEEYFDQLTDYDPDGMLSMPGMLPSDEKVGVSDSVARMIAADYIYGLRYRKYVIINNTGDIDKHSKHAIRVINPKADGSYKVPENRKSILYSEIIDDLVSKHGNPTAGFSWEDYINAAIDSPHLQRSTDMREQEYQEYVDKETSTRDYIREQEIIEDYEDFIQVQVEEYLNELERENADEATRQMLEEVSRPKLIYVKFKSGKNDKIYSFITYNLEYREGETVEVNSGFYGKDYATIVKYGDVFYDGTYSVADEVEKANEAMRKKGKTPKFTELETILVKTPEEAHTELMRRTALPQPPQGPQGSNNQGLTDDSDGPKQKNKTAIQNDLRKTSEETLKSTHGAVYDILKSCGAFNYVERGNLHEGDEIGFVVGSWKSPAGTRPIIYIVTKKTFEGASNGEALFRDHQVIGVWDTDSVSVDSETNTINIERRHHSIGDYFELDKPCIVDSVTSTGVRFKNVSSSSIDDGTIQSTNLNTILDTKDGKFGVMYDGQLQEATIVSSNNGSIQTSDPAYNLNHLFDPNASAEQNSKRINDESKTATLRDKIKYLIIPTPGGDTAQLVVYAVDSTKGNFSTYVSQALNGKVGEVIKDNLRDKMVSVWRMNKLAGMKISVENTKFSLGSFFRMSDSNGILITYSGGKFVCKHGTTVLFELPYPQPNTNDVAKDKELSTRLLEQKVDGDKSIIDIMYEQLSGTILNSLSTPEHIIYAANINVTEMAQDPRILPAMIADGLLYAPNAVLGPDGKVEVAEASFTAYIEGTKPEKKAKEASKPKAKKEVADLVRAMVHETSTESPALADMVSKTTQNPDEKASVETAEKDNLGSISRGLIRSKKKSSGQRFNYEMIPDDGLENARVGIAKPTKSKSLPKGYTSEMQAIKDEAIANGTFMKAPNGKPTNLNERQWLQVRTKAFKTWFGDWENDPANASKVVDENGEPLVVYHGNDAKFNESARENNNIYDLKSNSDISSLPYELAKLYTDIGISKEKWDEYSELERLQYLNCK